MQRFCGNGGVERRAVKVDESGGESTMREDKGDDVRSEKWWSRCSGDVDMVELRRTKVVEE